jgi:2-polyprenyl-3-methyl-5-hydroxy-6-metoxy-1,4-benzoquinol methylase
LVFPDLSRRDRRPEVMDDPGIAGGPHRRALAGLARLNRASGIAGAVWRRALASVCGAGRPVRVLDVACGSGDVIVDLARLAAREGVRLSATGWDRSATAVEEARRRAGAAGIEAEFVVGDAVRGPLAGEYDAVMTHLFLHHLAEEDIVGLLSAMGRVAGRLVVATDLVRDRRGYALAWAASRVLTRSPVVHADALLSVRAALRPAELSACARGAGLEASVERVWPRRMMLVARQGSWS